MTQPSLRLQYSFRALLVICLVSGVLTVSFATQIRQTIETIVDGGSTNDFRVTDSTKLTRAWDSWQAMHDYYEEEFVNGEGFGLRRVVDFDSPDQRPIEINDRLYTILALELISLEKSDEPVAYVNTAGYPVRKFYKQAKKRQLDDFEKQALRKLQARKDVVFNGNAEKPLFVGAIRAKKRCLQCHETRVGNLLGAFTYHLHPVGQESTAHLRTLDALLQATKGPEPQASP